MKAVALKLVLRSWWRNKTFSIISIISLAIGIGCTNLLAVFVIHEFNIEGENANKSRIYLISQDSPMKTGERTSFAFNTIPPIIKEKYPEVADYLRIDKKVVKYIAIDEVQYEPINLIIADASLSRFFPYETRYGNLDEALSEPNKIALTETTSQRFFGKANPIGKTVTVSLPEDKPATDGQATDERTYQVAAVIKERSQSFLNFDALTSFDQSDPYYGSPTFFMTNKPIDRKSVV